MIDWAKYLFILRLWSASHTFLAWKPQHPLVDVQTPDIILNDMPEDLDSHQRDIIVRPTSGFSLGSEQFNETDIQRLDRACGVSARYLAISLPLNHQALAWW